MLILDFFQQYADALQVLLIIMAGVTGFLWWQLRRERLPRAILELEPEHVTLDDGAHLLRVLVKIENIGQVLIEVARIRIHVCQMVPTPLIGHKDQTVPFDFSFDESNREIVFPALEVKTVDYDKDTRPEYEPTESGFLIFDFRLQEMPQVLSIYVHVRNEAKYSFLRRLLRRREIGWATTTIYRKK